PCCPAVTTWTSATRAICPAGSFLAWRSTLSARCACATAATARGRSRFPPRSHQRIVCCWESSAATHRSPERLALLPSSSVIAVPRLCPKPQEREPFRRASGASRELARLGVHLHLFAFLDEERHANLQAGLERRELRDAA